MKDKTVFITGSTDGIGKQTAIDLARMGASIILHGRDAQRCEAAQVEIKRMTGNQHILFFVADLSSQKQIRQLAGEIHAAHNNLDVLINNAGVYMKRREMTEDGLEMTFAVNHIAPFFLTQLLLDLFTQTTSSRIINVSSIAHTRARINFENLQGEMHYEAYGSYALSKLGNILFTYELAERMKNTPVTVNCLHPGVVTTKLLMDGFGTSGIDVAEGAATSVYLASSPDLEHITGKYFVQKKMVNSSEQSYDKNLWKKFREVSEKLIVRQERNHSAIKMNHSLI